MSRTARAISRHGRPRTAFTLVEVLVVVAIVGVLVALVLPAARGTMSAARGFHCEMGLRSVAHDFAIFADRSLGPFRGDDATALPAGRFRLETFLESQYRVDEFWEWPSDSRIDLPDERGNDPMRCPEVSGPVTLYRNLACTAGAVGPPQRISYGFNVRLHRAEQLAPYTVYPVRLDERVLEHGSAPLAWDVDGETAAAGGVSPLFSGPALDSPAAFAQDRYWFPSARHGGRTNVAFIDGHVEASRRPLDQPGWDWSYQGPR